VDASTITQWRTPFASEKLTWHSRIATLISVSYSPFIRLPVGGVSIEDAAGINLSIVCGSRCG
jgi:hypothetical protein